MEEEMKDGYDEKKEKALKLKRRKTVKEDFRKDFDEAEEDNDVDYDDLKKEKSERVETKEKNKFETGYLSFEL